VEYATTQNDLGNPYVDLAGVRDKESNLEKAINAYQEALKIYTVKRYPIEIVGKALFSNISALMYKLDRAQHSDLG